MKYSREVYEKTRAELSRRRDTAESEAQSRHDRFAAEHPELLWIEQEMAKTGLAAVQEVLGGRDAQQAIDELARYNLALQTDREKLLKTCRLPADWLKPRYACPLCGDTGYADGKMCGCQLALLQKYACKLLSDNTPLASSRFDNFDLSLYPKQKDKSGLSPYDCMRDIYEYCAAYADDFGEGSANLYLCGNTGLGKTHLSLAIANKVIEKGFGVVYDSAQKLLSRLERERFSRTEAENETEGPVLNCELLILDDLGAEFDTRFTSAEICNIVNTRLLAGRPTIISSNLGLKELEKRYTPRLVSRIIGSYELLLFAGSDIRQIKKNRRAEKTE